LKWWTTVAAALALLVVGASVDLAGQQPVGEVSLKRPRTWNVGGIEVLPVRGNVYLLAGAGANVTVQAGPDGLLLVDSGAAGQTERILAALREVFPDQRVREIVNTNADADHIGGNGGIVAAFGGARGQAVGGGPQGEGNQNVGVQIVSHENALGRMARDEPGRPALTGDALPGSTFSTDRKEFFSNGEVVQVLSQPKAHSDGDVLVFFRSSEVISAGDVWVTTSYPVIDEARGGSIQGILDGLNAIVGIAVPERNQMGGTRVISGHGYFGNESDIVEYRDMVTIIRDRVLELVNEGRTLAQIKAAKVSLDYDGIYGATSGTWTTDMFIEAVYHGVGGK
jgi:glyoxylase-like metal-dependent hydrolase (beta-lactamase superfamily II)